MNIADIARLAGVSNAAVSRYFNNGYISDEKKEAIRKVVEETGYRPSVQAQTLRTKKTHMVGVIIPKLASFSIGSVVTGINEVLTDHNYQMLLANTVNDPKKELEYLSVFKDKQVDGVILVATVLTPEHKKILKSMKVPVVVVGQRLPGSCCVYHDDYHCMYDMAKLFVERGCKNIGYISAPHADKSVGLARYEGARDAILEEAGIEFYDAMGDFSMESGYDETKELFEKCDKIDGIICATDTMSLGAMRYLREHNYRMPEDVILSGQGNYQYTNVTYPTITSIQFSYQESGNLGAEMLLDLLSKKNTISKEVMLGYHIIEKESTQRIS